MTDVTNSQPGGPIAQSSRESRFEPRQQVNFLGWYTLFALLFYTAAGLNAHAYLPPFGFYVVVILTFCVFWWSFWAQRVLSRVSNPVELGQKFWNWVVAYFAAHGKPDGRFSDIFRVEVETRAADDHFSPWDSGRVLGLALFAIAESAWLTTYSGGPFESPYSQVLIGFALLAPCVAYHSLSIVGTYVTVIVASVVVHWTMKSAVPPESAWYIWTTLFVLGFSALVAVITNEALRAEKSPPPRNG